MSGPTTEAPSRAAGVLYLVPGSLGEDAAARAELERRHLFLVERAPERCLVSLARTDGGPPSVESEEDEASAARAVVEELPALAALGFDAVIVGCFGDPGVEEARELVDFRVVGPAEASFRAAVDAGGPFAVLTVVDEVIPLIRRRIEAAGLSREALSVTAIDVGVHDLRPHRERVAGRLAEAGREAIDEGAQALVLGCMSMGFLGLDRTLAASLDVPVVNPVDAALEAAVR